MSTPSLGRLEKVEVRTVWTNEALDFTPWLAREENLALIGDVIGLDLELEAQEKDVGPFRADILCKDTVTSAWVLIENQLERTDHSHLGQLLTYAAGLEAVTIIWVSPRFTDEHRAALDWLNRVTAEGVNFFGLEIELWRIGDSPVAAKFNIISQPNDWSKTVSEGARRIEAGELSETKQLQLEYWTAFAAYVRAHSDVLRPSKPQADTWMSISIGRSGFSLAPTISLRGTWVYTGLELGGPDAKPHFHLLYQQREAVERAFGGPLRWQERPGKQQSYISVIDQTMDPNRRDQWPQQHAWLCERTEALHRTFAPLVRGLDARAYQTPTPDEAAEEPSA